MRRLPPLRALPAFEIAASRASISAAAEELHLTHSAISRQIKSIEDHLGVPLFRRLNRRIELTPAGAAFLPTVRKILQLLEASAARVGAQSEEGPLVVSCLATFMMRWLIPRLHSFSSAHPGIDVRLSASHAPARFAEDGIDVAVRIGKAPWPRRVAAHQMFPDHIGPVLSPALAAGHRLSRPADMRKVSWLHTDTRPQAWSEWLRLTGTRGIEPADGPHYEHTYFMLEAAASGLGAAIVSYLMVKEDLANGRLVAPFGFVVGPRAFYLLHAKRTSAAKKIAAFSAWIMEEAQRSPGPDPHGPTHT